MPITVQHWGSQVFDGSFQPATTPPQDPNIQFQTVTRWLCQVPYSITEVIRIMRETCPAYNNFDVETLDIYADELKNARIYIGREGSVCFYIDGIEGDEEAETALQNLCADEIDLQGDGIYRVWWD